jgi:predicted MFS family arabinose efflux permease
VTHTQSLATRSSYPHVRVYLVGFADAAGLGMYIALSALFLKLAVGLPIRQVGWTLSIAGIASLLGAIPIARSAQRYGLRAGLITLFLGRAVAFFALSAAGSFVTAAITISLTGLMSRGTAPLIEATAIFRNDNASAIKTLARLRMVRNAGFAAGGLPAGIAVSIGDPWIYRAVIASSALFFLLAALICLKFPDADSPQRIVGNKNRKILANRPFIALTTVYGALTTSGVVMSIGLPLWVISNSKIPHWTIGSIQVINTVLVVLLQTWACRGTEVLSKALSHMRIGCLIAALASAMLSFGSECGRMEGVLLVVTNVVLFTFAELFSVAGGEAAALAHIPEDQRPSYLAAFNLGFATATVIGPPLVTASVGHSGGYWFVWGAFFIVLAACVRLVPLPINTESVAAGRA